MRLFQKLYNILQNRVIRAINLMYLQPRFPSITFRSRFMEHTASLSLSRFLASFPLWFAASILQLSLQYLLSLLPMTLSPHTGHSFTSSIIIICFFPINFPATPCNPDVKLPLNIYKTHLGIVHGRKYFFFCKRQMHIQQN